MKIDTCYFSLSPPPTTDRGLLMAVPFCKVTYTLPPRRSLRSHEGRVQIDGDDWWAAGRHPLRADLHDGTRALSRGSPAHIPCNSCLSQSDDFILTATIPPRRLLGGIAPLKLISALTCVNRSNTCVCTFHAAHSSYDQPTPKLKPAAWMWKED